MPQPPGEVGVFFLGHAGLDYMAAVGSVVSLGYGYQLLSVGVVVLSLIGEKQGLGEALPNKIYRRGETTDMRILAPW